MEKERVCGLISYWHFRKGPGKENACKESCPREPLKAKLSRYYIWGRSIHTRLGEELVSLEIKFVEVVS